MTISIITIVSAIFFGILNFYLFAPALSFHSPALFAIILMSALIAFALTYPSASQWDSFFKESYID